MKASPTMHQVVQQLVERHGVDLAQVGAFLRLDLPDQDSLVIDHMGTSQIAVTSCFAEAGDWKIDREVIFFTGDSKQWIPIEITQQATGWKAFAKLDAHGQRLLRINHCDQERLADFAERWACMLIRQHWLELGIPYVPWTPPSRKELA